MPIRRQHRWLYPIDWSQISASIRFGRAKGRCEHCGRPHGRLVFHLGEPFGFDGERRVGRTGHSERLLAWRRGSKGQGRRPNHGKSQTSTKHIVLDAEGQFMVIWSV